MEVAKDDLGTAAWGGNAAGTKTAVGTGRQNTQLITNAGGMAAMICAAYQGGGFSDWFLPSKDELNLIYINLVRISHIVDWEDTYWSSSQTNNTWAWKQQFSDGGQGDYPKTSIYSVCAIRQF
jgi:hypothetical protein